MSSFLPILMLLVVIGLVVTRLPKVELGHSEEFKKRRVLNWLPLGLTYALLYFGRYNLSAIVPTLETAEILTKKDFGTIEFVGSITYGVSFLINGPLTDRWGGRATILIAALGSAIMNIVIGVIFYLAYGGAMTGGTFTALTVAYALNMYFQSFGAVSIVKVNAPWFHLRERGVLGGLFGILISLGLYFSYDLSRAIVGATKTMEREEIISLTFASMPSIPMTFFIPAVILLVFFVVDYFLIRNTPGDAGFEDFDTADASSGDTSTNTSVMAVFKRMFSQKVIWIIVAIEFCSGFLRNAIMKWYLIYTKGLSIDNFITQNWGLVLCIAGILGGTFAGFISDHVFGSRRGPVASVLYAGMLLGSILMMAFLGHPILGWTAVFMSLCIIGVHGMLSGTASMDFGGKKNAGLVTGIIDGFVYLGTGTQGLVFGLLLPQDKASSAVLENWFIWPTLMLPFALVGLVLALLVWNARPQKAGAH